MGKEALPKGLGGKEERKGIATPRVLFPQAPSSRVSSMGEEEWVSGWGAGYLQHNQTAG